MESPFVDKGSATTGFGAGTLLWQLNHPKTGDALYADDAGGYQPS